MKEMEYSYKIFIAKSERKRIFGRPRNRYKNDNKMDLKEIWCVVLDCILVAQYGDRWCSPINVVTNYWFSKR
jgi:hypothetical protein